MLGKLKKTLKERCPDCGKVLQLRIIEEEGIRDGLPFTYSIERIVCSNINCGYERYVEKRKKRERGQSQEDLKDIF